jgi:hypothetical protein
MIGMIGFNKYLLVIFDRRIDWRQVWSEDLDMHWRKLPGSQVLSSESTADQNNVNINEEKYPLSNINEKKRENCVVIRRISTQSLLLGRRSIE